ncbi:MAG: molybdate ABC transporter substrate-binding protein [Armatimonadetes bacterium]|nr:molybdate ABC transporter substrate-binding protein [Armatimonadota bacterium]
MRQFVTALLLSGALAVTLAGCTPKATPGGKVPNMEGKPLAKAETGKDEGKGGAPAESGAWKAEYGPSDAKVVVECFYPMEGHDWVKALNKKILDKYPDEVRILHINWQTDEGLRVLEAEKLEPCGQYLVNKKVVVKKNPVLGGWKDEDLLKAVDEEVHAKYPKKVSMVTGNVVVHVPCGLAGPFGDVRARFAKEHSDIKLTARIANTLVLRDRIHEGEGGDVFLCMGDIELDPLKEKQRIDLASATTVATTSLSIITPLNNPGEIRGLKDLGGPKVRRIALGDAKGLSVGKQGVAALTKCGLWDKVKDRVYYVKEAATLKIIVAEGKVDAALVYTSCLHETHTPGTKPAKVPVRTVCEIPVKMYDPVKVVGVSLIAAKSPEAAKRFLQYCAGPESHKIFETWGFLQAGTKA